MEAIKLYLKEVKDIPLLTPQEEIELAKRVNAGDEEARKRMIRSNLRLVINIAKRYTHLGVPLIDLIEEGNLGLMKAVDKFNPNKGYRFSTYAAWWIRQYITRAIADQGKIIRIPVYMTEIIAKWKKANEELTQKLKRKPRLTEVAKRMRLPVKKVKEINNLVIKTPSLDEPISEEGDIEFIDLIEDKTSISPVEEMAELLRHERIVNLLEMMDEREKIILDLRFGLTDGSSHTLNEIAETLGITRERVRQIEAGALKKLRKFVTQQEKEPFE
jgi:RNA polymerase primary sigma factor